MRIIIPKMKPGTNTAQVLPLLLDVLCVSIARIYSAGTHEKNSSEVTEDNQIQKYNVSYFYPHAAIY